MPYLPQTLWGTARKTPTSCCRCVTSHYIAALLLQHTSTRCTDDTGYAYTAQPPYLPDQQSEAQTPSLLQTLESRANTNGPPSCDNSHAALPSTLPHIRLPPDATTQPKLRCNHHRHQGLP
jgi:hypothetical protein